MNNSRTNKQISLKIQRTSTFLSPQSNSAEAAATLAELASTYVAPSSNSKSETAGEEEEDLPKYFHNTTTGVYLVVFLLFSCSFKIITSFLLIELRLF